ncbi:hypothetical protein [Paramicrobacterium agarici]|uniref:hypothetical protein n=1 Tax=Paramicrobacterium agarici TaxID=630514 RepID=UPI0011536B8F|nr:hypothetical protein [Microbacterium agarici]
MTEETNDRVIPDPPTKPGESVTFFGGSSGEPVVVTKRPEENVYEIHLPKSPDYAALLVRDGRDSFDLIPADGVTALGGTGIDWRLLVDRF